MNIKAAELSYKKKVGNIKGAPVIELGTSGGLHLLVVARRGTFETIGTGPHRAVARFIAKKREPDLEITEISKSDAVDPSSFEHLVSRYEELTNSVRTLEAETHGEAQ